MKHASTTALVPITSRALTSQVGVAVPSIVDRTATNAPRRFIEFFVVTIRNQNTRDAYYRACCRFLSWCDQHRIVGLMSIQPIHVAAYIEILGREFEKPTVKQHLAAIRVLFDWLVIGQVIPTNPATSVRGPKHDVTRGTTPVLASMEVRQILDHIDTSNIVGLRDRALIALMVFSFARISAALSMRVDDYFLAGDRWWVRLQEKGGKRHEMPAHRELQIFMNKYVEVGQLWREPNAPLFRAFGGGNEFPSALSRIEAYRMIQRRAGQASIATKLCCHSFRATGITIYLSNGGTLEKAQAMAAHKSPRTTKLYDRTDDAVKLEEVERIAI